MAMKIRLSRVLAAILLLSFFSCGKELSYEKGTGGNSGGTGVFRAKIDGVDWVATDASINVIVLSGAISITGTSSDNKAITMTLLAPGTGTYVLDANSAGLGTLDEAELGGPVTYTTQGGDTSQAGGSVVITSIDANSKTISGTFSFKVYDPNSGVTKVISEGVFENLPYSNTLPPAPTTDTFSVKIGGTLFVASSIASTNVSGSLFLQGASSNGTNFVGLLMPQNVQPGSYTLDFNTGQYIGQYSPDPSTILISQGNGTLTITENNTTTKRITGTFSFVASDVNQTQSVNLTEGFFSVGY
jgi:hypothetical protein